MNLDLLVNFSPHGLILTPHLSLDYRSANTAPRELQALKLLENIFNKVLFRDRDDVTVNSIGSSSYDYVKPNSHFVVTYIDDENNNNAAEILCFTDDITRDSHQDSPVRNFETRVFRHCRECFDRPGQATREFFHVCTAFGTRLRLWKLFRGDREACGLWGGYGLTVDDSTYLDVGDDEASERIKRAFDRIIDNQSSNHGEEEQVLPNVYPATVPRQVEVWLAKNDEGDTCRFFYSRGKAIGTKPSDWEKVDSKLFSKKRLVYKKNDHNVWAMVSRLGD